MGRDEDFQQDAHGKEPSTGKEVKLEIELDADNPGLCLYLKMPGMSGFVNAEDLEKLAVLLVQATGDPVFAQIRKRQARKEE